jgi:hypothetical protein
MGQQDQVKRLTNVYVYMQRKTLSWKPAESESAETAQSSIATRESRAF